MAATLAPVGSRLSLLPGPDEVCDAAEPIVAALRERPGDGASFFRVIIAALKSTDSATQMAAEFLVREAGVALMAHWRRDE